MGRSDVSVGWPIRYLFVYLLLIYLGICLSKLLNHLFSALWLLVKKKMPYLTETGQSLKSDILGHIQAVPQFPVNLFVPSGLFLLKSLVKSVP